ncbi:MAG: protein kinase [Myxococcales bacterium]|nr:protein kinase [Myxococcales bacterium]
MISVHQLEGQKISKYQIRRKIGDGGQAVVYEAYYEDLDTTVAIKFLQDRIAQMPHIRERFKREARLQFKLQHPHIIRVLEIIEEGEILGMVMDWIEGPDLEHYLTDKAGPLSAQEVEMIFPPVLQALSYAHKKKIVHRDLKPANILLEISGETFIPKVMDFGIAKSLEDESQQTKTNTLLGTPQYIAPEQANSSKHVDHRADIYGLGIILYRMLAGRLPFEGRDLLQLITAHMLEDPPPIESWGVVVPPEVEAVARKALAKRPEERFDSCESFAFVLQKVLQGRYHEVRHLLAPPSRALFNSMSGTASLNPFADAPTDQSLLQAPTSSPQNPFTAPPSSIVQTPLSVAGRPHDTPLPITPPSDPFHAAPGASLNFQFYQAPTLAASPEELLRLGPAASPVPFSSPISPIPTPVPLIHSLEAIPKEEASPRIPTQFPLDAPPSGPQHTSPPSVTQQPSADFMPLPSGEVATYSSNPPPSHNSRPPMRQHMSAPPQDASQWISIATGVLGLVALVLVLLWGRPGNKQTQEPPKPIATQRITPPPSRKPELRKQPEQRQIPAQPAHPPRRLEPIAKRVIPPNPPRVREPIKSPTPPRTGPVVRKTQLAGQACSSCLRRVLALQQGASPGLSVDAVHPCSHNAIQRAIRRCYKKCAQQAVLFCKVFGQQKAPMALFSKPKRLSKHGSLCRPQLLAKLVTKAKSRFTQQVSRQNCIRAFYGKSSP